MKLFLSLLLYWKHTKFNITKMQICIYVKATFIKYFYQVAGLETTDVSVGLQRRQHNVRKPECDENDKGDDFDGLGSTKLCLAAGEAPYK